jgi:hypothetical protein
MFFILESPHRCGVCLPPASSPVCPVSVQCFQVTPTPMSGTANLTQSGNGREPHCTSSSGHAAQGCNAPPQGPPPSPKPPDLLQTTLNNHLSELGQLFLPPFFKRTFPFLSLSLTGGLAPPCLPFLRLSPIGRDSPPPSRISNRPPRGSNLCPRQSPPERCTCLGWPRRRTSRLAAWD